MAETTVFDDEKLNSDMQGVKQYFWHVEEGDDAGTHITEVPQEQFVISPDGYNLLSQSSGVYIRDGLDKIAEFEPDGVNFNAIVDSSLVSVAEYGVNGARIGENTKTHTIIDADGMQVYADDGVTLIANLGYGEGESQSGTDIAPYYTFGTRMTDSSIGNYSMAIGNKVTASGWRSYAEGFLTVASGTSSHAEGNRSVASGSESHAEGYKTTATSYAHAEGYESTASGRYSHAEGAGTTSSGARSHAEGSDTTSSGDYSHAEGYNCTASGSYSHAQNRYTTADGEAQTVIGKYNIANTTSAFIIGNGSTSPFTTSNALTVDWSGNQWIAGTLTQGSDRRLKEHICYLSQDAIDFVRKLKPAHYIKSKEKHVGFYAQDIQKIDKWDCMVGEDDNGYLTLGYTEIIAPLVTYCQHLEKRIEELEKINLNI